MSIRPKRFIDAEELKARIATRETLGKEYNILELIESTPTANLDDSNLTINGYQAHAMRTASGMNPEYPRILNGVLGLTGESGECADVVKKFLFHGHDLDKAHLAKELGDVAWYLAVSAEAIGYDLQTILQMNVDKLKARYPEGFDSERSRHREEGDI